MALKQSVFWRSLKYKGGGPMLAFALHRIGGLAMVAFVGAHILSSFFMQQSASDLATAINTIYESPYFQIIFYFLVIFHALNGLRIILLDVWPSLLQYQRELIWLQWLIFIPLYGLAAFLMLQSLLSGA